MSQPLFSCSKCFGSFPQAEMSRSGQSCKNCNPRHSTFKQCEFCRSDFKYYIYGNICPRCQSLKAKFGDPQQCTICLLQTAFGNALVCLRCQHYRNRFGEPRECQSCGKICAFLKDEASRQKVDGQTLCWVCTYNFKVARSRERSTMGTFKRRHDSNVTSSTASSRLKVDNNSQSMKRTHSDTYGLHKIDSIGSSCQGTGLSQTRNIDSVYNEHLLTISQLQDEVKLLKRQLAQKDADMLTKDRTIADLRSEIIEMKGLHDDRLQKLRAESDAERDRLSALVKQLHREKSSLNQNLKRRKSGSNLSALGSVIRHSSSTVNLFNPDSPLTVRASGDKNPHCVSIEGHPGNMKQPSESFAYVNSTPNDDRDRVRTKTEQRKHGTNMEHELSSDEDMASSSKIRQQEREPAHHQSDLIQMSKLASTSPDLASNVSSTSQPTDEETVGGTWMKDAKWSTVKAPLGLDTLSDSDDNDDREEIKLKLDTDPM